MKNKLTKNIESILNEMSVEKLFDLLEEKAIELSHATLKYKIELGTDTTDLEDKKKKLIQALANVSLLTEMFLFESEDEKNQLEEIKLEIAEKWEKDLKNK